MNAEASGLVELSDLATAIAGLPIDQWQSFSFILNIVCDDDLTQVQLRIQCGLGSWSVTTHGFGLGRDFNKSGPWDDVAGFREAVALVGEHSGRPGNLRLVKP